MEALVLAGGRGRRLAPFTTIFPKPLAPIGETPIIDILLRQLRAHGVRRVHVSLGYLGELIQAYFLTRGELPGLEVRYVRERQPLGTAGPVRMLGPVDDGVLVLNGDVLTTFDFGRFVRFFGEERPALAIAVIPRTTTVDLGVVQTDPSGDVTGFLEKPTIEHLCSMGINIYGPAAVAAIEEDESIDLPTLALRLIARGERVVSFRDECYWMDIGRRDDYERALDEFPEMRALLLPEPEPGD